MADKPLTESYELQSEDKEIQAMTIMWECLYRRFLYNDYDVKAIKRVAHWVNTKANDLDHADV